MAILFQKNHLLSALETFDDPYILKTTSVIFKQALVSVKKCTNILIYDIDTFVYRDKCLCVMVSVFGSSAIDRKFELWSGQTKDYKTELVLQQPN